MKGMQHGRCVATLRWIALSLLVMPGVLGATFSSPASLNGHAEGLADGWLLGVIEPQQTQAFDMEADEGRARIHERIQSDTNAGPAGDIGHLERDTGTPEWTQTPPWSAGSQADAIVFLARLEHAKITFDGQAAFSSYLAGQEINSVDQRLLQLATLSEAVAQDGVLARLDGRGTWTLQTSASEWYGLRCDVCPEPNEELAAAPGHSTGIHRTIEIDADMTWTLNANGRFYVLSPTSDWRVEGALRLPVFSDGNGTRTLVGATNLTALQMQSPTRMSADVSGEWTQVFADERPDSGWMPLTAATVAAAAGSLALVLLGLVAKEILAEPLNNEKRRYLYRTIQERPGLHFRELQRASGYGNGALLYSLRILASSKLIRSEAVQGRRHYYAVASVEFHEQDALLHGLQARRLARILSPFQDSDQVLRRDLVQHLEVVGESRATAYRLVKRLIEAQVLEGESALHLNRIPAMLSRSWPMQSPDLEAPATPSTR